MTRKKYIIPQIDSPHFELNGCLLAGSPTPRLSPVQPSPSPGYNSDDQQFAKKNDADWDF